MEPTFNTSFIPKKPIQTQVGKVGSARKDGINFFMLIAVILFLASLLLTAGVFAYKLTVQGSIESQIRTLEKAQQAFDPKFVVKASRLNSRIINANDILNSHLAPSEIFDLLEEFTLQTVTFSSFKFEDGEDGTIKILASGEGDSFRSIVLQSDKFGESGYLRDVLFSGLEPTEFNNIAFSFEASLDPQLILYRKSLSLIEIEAEAEPVVEEQADLGIFGNDQQ